MGLLHFNAVDGVGLGGFGGTSRCVDARRAGVVDTHFLGTCRQSLCDGIQTREVGPVVAEIELSLVVHPVPHVVPQDISPVGHIARFAFKHTSQSVGSVCGGFRRQSALAEHGQVAFRPEDVGHTGRHCGHG